MRDAGRIAVLVLGLVEPLPGQEPRATGGEPGTADPDRVISAWLSAEGPGTDAALAALRFASWKGAHLALFRRLAAGAAAPEGARRNRAVQGIAHLVADMDLLRTDEKAEHSEVAGLPLPERREAADRILSVAWGIVAGGLADALWNPDEHTALLASRAFGNFGPIAAPAAHALCDAYEQERPAIRHWIVWSLAHLKELPDEAVPVLRSALRSRNLDLVQNAAFAVRFLGLRAEPVLGYVAIHLAEMRRPLVRQNAVHAIGMYVNAIRNAHADGAAPGTRWEDLEPDDVTLEMEDELRDIFRRFGGALAARVPDADAEVAIGAAYALGRLGSAAGDAVPDLLAHAIHGRPPVESEIFWALGEIGEVGGLPPEAFARVEAGLRSPSAAVIENALWALQALGDRGAELLDTVRRILRETPEGPVGEGALDTLRKLGLLAAPAAPDVLRASRRGGDREACLEALAAMGPAGRSALRACAAGGEVSDTSAQVPAGDAGDRPAPDVRLSLPLETAPGALPPFPADELQWAETASTRPAEPATHYTVVGRGYFFAECAAGTQSFLESWVAEHPGAQAVPVARLGPAFLDDPDTSLVMIWLVGAGARDVANIALAAGGFVHPETLETPGKDIWVPKAVYGEFLERVRAAAAVARDSGKGLWGDRDRRAALAATTAWTLEKVEDFEGAALWYRRAIALGGGDADTFLRLAQCLERTGDLAEALKAFDRAIGDGTSWPPYVERMKCVERAEGVAGALAWIAERAAVTPGDRKWDHIIARFHAEQGRFLEASEARLRSIESACAAARVRFDEKGRLFQEAPVRTGDEPVLAELAAALDDAARWFLELGAPDNAFRLATRGVSVGQHIVREAGYFGVAEIEAGSAPCRLILARILIERGALAAAGEQLAHAAVLAARGGDGGAAKEELDLLQRRLRRVSRGG